MEPQSLGSAVSRDRYLLCSRKDGIGARLCNLVWTWRLARNSGLGTLCLWPSMAPYYGNANGVADILDVYTLATSSLQDELRIIDAKPIDTFWSEVVRLRPRERHEANDYAVSPSLGIGTKRKPFPVIDSLAGPLLAPGEDPASATQSARELFGRLPLSWRIRQNLDSVNTSLDLTKMIAVHVRRGDIIDTLRSACAEFTPESKEPGSALDVCTAHFLRGCVPPSTYLDLMRPYLEQGYGVLFFSDTPGSAQLFESEIRSPLIRAAGLSSLPLSPSQQAMFEMVLMSRCHAIVGPRSLFSRTASLMGGAPLIDAHRRSSAEDFLQTYARAVRFRHLEPGARAGAAHVLVRALKHEGFLERWETGEGDILRLLEAADGG